MLRLSFQHATRSRSTQCMAVESEMDTSPHEAGQDGFGTARQEYMRQQLRSQMLTDLCTLASWLTPFVLLLPNNRVASALHEVVSQRRPLPPAGASGRKRSFGSSRIIPPTGPSSNMPPTGPSRERNSRPFISFPIRKYSNVSKVEVVAGPDPVLIPCPTTMEKVVAGPGPERTPPSTAGIRHDNRKRSRNEDDEEDAKVAAVPKRKSSAVNTLGLVSQYVKALLQHTSSSQRHLQELR